MRIGPSRVKRAMLVAVATASALSLSAPAHAGAGKAPSPPSDRITVDVVAVNGSGCPAGTANVWVSEDNTEFRVRYHDYVAEVGTGKPTDFRKNCQLALQVHVPQGFTYAIAEVDYRGYASLRSGATALQRANYYFQGQSESVKIDHSFSGPLRSRWQTTDSTTVEELVWAPCGEYKNLNINTELRVHAGSSHPGSNSYISMSSTAGDIDTIYHFAWKRC